MKTRTRPGPRTGKKDLPIDVICGAEVTDPSQARKVTFRGETYYFCCQECASRFAAAGKKAGKEKQPRPPARARQGRSGEE